MTLPFYRLNSVFTPLSQRPKVRRARSAIPGRRPRDLPPCEYHWGSHWQFSSSCQKASWLRWDALAVSAVRSGYGYCSRTWGVWRWWFLVLLSSSAAQDPPRVLIFVQAVNPTFATQRHHLLPAGWQGFCQSAVLSCRLDWMVGDQLSSFPWH